MTAIINEEKKINAENVFHKHLSMFTDGMSKEDYANLFTEDAVQEYPYAPAPFATKIEGRDAIAAYIENVVKGATNWNFTDFNFSSTSNPDVFFVEFQGSALVTSTGKTYNQLFIARITMSGDKIANFKEYWNPTWILDAFV
ncbi:nuclear transport factor 2 family protein [Chryseobacterium sp. 2R14A]|uniref:nuclear transport factor 2 family protein n=1 Tax=Chryseobacterium sp. 2R14A TaxID=3380353 RepID=UPI003CF1F83A